MTLTSTATAPASVSRRWTRRMYPLCLCLYAQIALSIIDVTGMSAWVSLCFNGDRQSWHKNSRLLGDNVTDSSCFHLIGRDETSESLKNSEMCGKR